MFLKSHYFWRTYLGYVSVGLIGTFLFAVSLVRTSERQILEKTEVELLNTVEILSLTANSALQNLAFDSIRATAEAVSQSSGLRVTIIDEGGVVVADSHENPLMMENHLRRPEVQMAVQNGLGRSERYSFTLEEGFRYLAKPLVTGNQLNGIVRVARSYSDIDSELREAENQLIRNASMMSFLILLVAFYLAARQAVKITELTVLAEEIARGNFSRRIPEANSVGLKKISEAINEMARNSANRMTDVTMDRNRLSTIFTCMVEGVIDVDMEQNILHINDAAARLLGVSEKTCIGKPLWEEIRNQEIIDALDKAMKTLSVIKTQIRVSRNSSQRVVDVYAASLSDDDGAPIGVILVLHDITDLKNLERVRTDFVANASHELKTPITAIRGITETLLSDEDIDKETMDHFMERVHAQSLRLSQLIADLMTISRLENTQGEEAFTRINFADLARTALNAAMAAAEEKGLVVKEEITDQDLPIYGDKQNINQLLDNLLDNAIKYTEEPGTISVRLKSEEGWAVLEVQDTGLGISPQYQQRIFERFYRVDKSRSQSLGGTGLGLSIVKNIAEKHGGSVQVNSRLGSGTTFTFKIPLAESQKP